MLLAIDVGNTQTVIGLYGQEDDVRPENRDGNPRQARPGTDVRDLRPRGQEIGPQAGLHRVFHECFGRKWAG